MSRRRASMILTFAISLAVVLTGCQKGQQAAQQKKTIVVTYSVLETVVRDLVGDAIAVKGEIPNGLDPHEWEPSAKDVEALNKADLIVQNGLGLEGGMEKALKSAIDAGVKVFTASDAIQVRHVGEGEGIPSGAEVQRLVPPKKDPLQVQPRE